jgi:glyoxylase I family protein
MPDVRFSHVALNCRDPLATERFYSRYFGFRRARVVPDGGGQVVFIRSGPVLLELFQGEGAAPTPPAEGAGPVTRGVRHLAFQTDDVAAVLASMGDEAEVTLGPLDFGEAITGWRTAWVRDPDGVIVEISQGYVDQSDPPAYEPPPGPTSEWTGETTSDTTSERTTSS